MKTSPEIRNVVLNDCELGDLCTIQIRGESYFCVVAQNSGEKGITVFGPDGKEIIFYSPVGSLVAAKRLLNLGQSWELILHIALNDVAFPNGNGGLGSVMVVDEDRYLWIKDEVDYK